MKKLNESVLDPIQKNRCDALFDVNDTSEQPKIKKEARDFIIGLLNKFREETGLQFNYDQAFIVGSSLGFQYRDDSDIDVNVRVDLGKDFFKGKFHLIPKNVMLPDTAHPINVFLMTKDDPQYNFEKDAENAYDLLTDTWIKQGRLSNATAIPYEYIAGVSEFIMDGMALELHRAERDMYDLEKYLRLDPNKVAITIKDINDAVSKKIGDLIIDKDALTLAHTLMFRMERDGFNDQPINVSIKYTHDSHHYSMNNLIYKYVDSFQYYDKINKMLNEINQMIKKAKKHLEDTQELVDTPEARNNAEAQSEVEGAIENSQETDTTNTQSEAQNQVEESWTDNELKNILIQNGYESDNDSIHLLRENLNKKLFLVDGVDDDLNLLESSLADKTEKSINKIIYRKSGKIGRLASLGLGFLIAGPIGAVLAKELYQDQKYNQDAKYDDLFAEVESNPECSSIIDKIKEELKKDNPDKAKIRNLKKEFAKAVSKCKKNLKPVEPEMSKISLKETLNDDELLDILRKNGYKDSTKNLNILKENTNYVLEEEGNKNEN